MPTVNRKAPDERHVQSLVYAKDEGWTYEKAKDDAQKRGYNVDGHDETKDSHRFRQYDPEENRFDYFNETEDNDPKGLTKVVGYPKNNSSSDGQKTKGAAETALHMAENQPWAILPGALEMIFDIAERRNDLEAVQRELGRPLNNAQTTTVRETENGPVAVIPLSGPIFRHANLFTEISGATSIDKLSTDFGTALDDPQIRGIVFEIDTPGGTVAGVQEFATMVYEARGKKPIAGWVDHKAASAGYWIGSAVETLAMAKSSRVGSIGVVATVPRKDPDKETREFVSSYSPSKRPDPDSDDGAREIQAQVDDIAAVFISDVAQFRGVSEDTVRSDFGKGGMVVGKKAVKARMADRVTTFEKFITTLAPTESKKTIASGARGTETPHKTQTKEEGEGSMGILSKLGLKAKEEETDEQAEARLERISAAFPEDQQFCFEQFKAGSDVADAVKSALDAKDQEKQQAVQEKDQQIETLTGERDQAKQRAEKAESDLKTEQEKVQDRDQKLQSREKRPVVNVGEKGSKPETSDEKLKEEYNASEELQAEFPTENAYLAYMKHNAAGHVKRLGANDEREQQEESDSNS